ncbi:unnamed protein product [Trichogramma brassicae]|uniref:Uncharacterized protein n=1 Tax=Trichogramma brassicae TaxID=86971 RepID=A0A6H5IGK9_9HYME|nr:unnamed protein product [Trichogramma brassicae]
MRIAKRVSRSTLQTSRFAQDTYSSSTRIHSIESKAKLYAIVRVLSMQVAASTLETSIHLYACT